MSALVEHLRSFNRKERFILLREALGDHTFLLDDDFRRRLEQCVGLTIPQDAFVAMDYHLDWLQMSLYLAANPSPTQPMPNDGLVTATQRDVDLLVAFDEGATTHLLLLEAKMETAWNSEQLRKKAKRLRCIFGPDRPGTDQVDLRLVLLSPGEPTLPDSIKWPDKMKPKGKPLWMELPRPPGLRKVTRCRKDLTPSARGTFLRIDA